MDQLFSLLQLPFLQEVEEGVALALKGLILEDLERHGRRRIVFLKALPRKVLTLPPRDLG